MLLQSKLRAILLCQLMLVFTIACSLRLRADDKHKSGSSSSSSGSSGHSSGSSGHGSSGGSSRSSSSGGSSHSSSAPHYDRSAGSSGHSSSTGGSSNGSYRRTDSGNSSHGNSGNYSHNNEGNNSRNTRIYNKSHENNNSRNGDHSNNNSGNTSNSNNSYNKNSHNTRNSNNDNSRNNSYNHENHSNNKTVVVNKTTINNYGGPRRTEYHVAGHTVARDTGGHVREIRDVHDRRGTMVIHHDTYGHPRYVTTVTGGGRIVGWGHGRGFAERRYVVPGRSAVYYQRTYIYGGRPYVVAYRYHPYRGVYYYSYAPVFYYRPVFYGWVYRPWVRPVYFRWGWYSDPWYPYYGYYFRPYPYYDTPSLWLTDFLLAENLRLAYEAQANANAAAAAQYSAPPPSSEVALSPEVKQLVANEVQRQLAAERAAAEQDVQPTSTIAPPQGANLAPQEQEEMPAALDPNQKVFIVSSNLDLVSEQGECSVTPGDVLIRTGTEPDEHNRIGITVLSSKKGDCPVNTNTAVEVTDLQEMHNHFREKLDHGLKALADNSGKNGLPQAPDTTTMAGEVPQPQPDSDAAQELKEQQQSAEKAEKEVRRDPGGGQP